VSVVGSSWLLLLLLLSLLLPLLLLVAWSMLPSSCELAAVVS
jgi:hypothetical protein